MVGVLCIQRSTKSLTKAMDFTERGGRGNGGERWKFCLFHVGFSMDHLVNVNRSKRAVDIG